ncbi:MAG: hypothetical protein R2939_22400 [Kofleriaceae bacterium]
MGAADDKFEGDRTLLERTVTAGPAVTAAADRARAFADPDGLPGARGRYCGQVALDATGVTDDDVAALRAEGLGDVEIFEYTVAAAVGQAGRQLDAALAALRGSKG